MGAIAIHLSAKWDAKQQKMNVSLLVAGQTHIERMTREQWDEYMRNLDNGPLRFGAYTLQFEGDQKLTEEAVTGLKQHLRDVDRTLRLTGQTERLLPSDTCLCGCHKEGESVTHVHPCCELCGDKYINADDTVDMHKFLIAVEEYRRHKGD